MFVSPSVCYVSHTQGGGRGNKQIVCPWGTTISHTQGGQTILTHTKGGTFFTHKWGGTNNLTYQEGQTVLNHERGTNICTWGGGGHFYAMWWGNKHLYTVGGDGGNSLSAGTRIWGVGMALKFYFIIISNIHYILYNTHDRCNTISNMFRPHLRDLLYKSWEIY